MLWRSNNSSNSKGKSEFNYKETLKSEEVKEFLKKAEWIAKQSNRIFRANNGGGMPCPHDICTHSSIFDFLSI